MHTQASTGHLNPATTPLLKHEIHSPEAPTEIPQNSGS